MYYEDFGKKVGKIVLIVTGGIGRNIMASAVIRNLKKTYPDKEIIVFAGCSELFLKNPNISRVLTLSQPNYFFEDYVAKDTALVIDVEPYRHVGYLKRETHFTKAWCELAEIPCDSIKPEMFFNINEQEIARDYLKKFDRRMVLFQHQGGKVPENPTKKDKIIAKTGMYRRSLSEEVAQKVTDGLIDMGFMVGSVGSPNQFLPKGAEAIKFPIRAICGLVPYVAGVISIDSFLLHASACYDDIKILALWGGTNPNALGYPWHVNLARAVCDSPMCHRPNSYLFDIEQTGFLWDCPHNDICMSFDADLILAEFKKIMGEKDEPRKETEVKDNTCREEEGTVKCEGCPAN